MHVLGLCVKYMYENRIEYYSRVNGSNFLLGKESKYISINLMNKIYKFKKKDQVNLKINYKRKKFFLNFFNMFQNKKDNLNEIFFFCRL